MIINGFCKQVFRELPMEFAVEAQKLLSITWKEVLDQVHQHSGDQECART